DRNDAVQRGYAQLLDQNRGNAALAALYNVLDFADQSAIQSAFESWAPTTETAALQMVAQSYNQVQSFNASRLRESTLASSGGT
ncbi:hypothetical protein, partial [Erythrobacter sp. HI0077]